MKIKGILRNTLWMLAGTVLWCSCYDERVMDEVPVVGEDMTISFISNPMQRYQVTSRASDAKEDDEKRINQLYIFFFDADGNYLNGTYLTGYDDASARETGGYLAPGQGVSLVKIDKEGFRTDDEKNKAKTAIVYVVANVEPALFRDVDDAGRPVKFENMAALEEYMYSPSGELSIGLPRNGMPMVGKATMDLTGESTPAEDRVVEMKALMARVDVNIQLASETTDGQLPSFMLTDWSVVNLPTKVKLGDVTITGALEDKATEETPMQRVIYNRNGEIAFSFYMFENIQEAKTDNEEWTAMGGKYPDSISLSQQQRYKPYLADKDNATALKLHGFYTTYNDATYEVSYTLYLGANHTNDFKVKRNHQYKNDITITGLTAQSSTNGEYTLDARVNVEEENNKYYISMLRERNHDAHFCVTPMDVYFFDEDKNP